MAGVKVKTDSSHRAGSSSAAFTDYLVAAAAAGEEKQASFAKAVISVRKPGAADFVYLNCTFAGVYVVEYQLALKNTKTGLPDETVKFVSECYSVRYVKQFASGSRPPRANRSPSSAGISSRTSPTNRPVDRPRPPGTGHGQ